MHLIDSVTFGITCFERPKELKRLLNSIYLFFDNPNVIVVCDSKKPSREKIIAKAFDKVQFIFTEYDIGLSAKRNLIYKNSSKEFILVLEEDFEFYNNSLESALVYMKQEELDLLGGRVLNYYQLDFVNIAVAFKKIILKSDFSRIRNILQGNHVELNHYGVFEVINNRLFTQWNSIDLELNDRKKFDIYPNFFLIKRSLLIKVAGWQPESLKNGEHGLFFVRLFQKNINSQFYFGFSIFHKPKKRILYIIKRMRKMNVNISDYHKYKEINF